MSRQQKILFPKNSRISGFEHSGSSLSFNRRGEERPVHRVLRTKRKHVQRACERCRAKKAKCDGLQPCSRCVTYNQACIFRDRKANQEKVYSRGFVEMLIAQHAVHLQALRDLYKRCVHREGFPGSPLPESYQGYPGTHAILDRLGLIRHAEESVEDPQRVLEDLVDFIKSLDSAPDCCRDSVESSTADSTSETTVSEEFSPEPSTPAGSTPDSVILPATESWMTATSDETQLRSTYDDHEPMNQQCAEMGPSGDRGDAGIIKTDEHATVLWDYFPSQVGAMSSGEYTSYPRTETLHIPSFSVSQSFCSEVPNQPWTYFVPMPSRAGVSAPLVYMADQPNVLDGYVSVPAQSAFQHQHQHQRQRQRQFRHPGDDAFANSGGQYVYP